MVRILSTHTPFFKNASRRHKSITVSNERLKPLKKQVSKYFASELRNASEGAAANLPSPVNIRHVREERNMFPNPQTLDEIPKIPQKYQLTTNGDQFLVFHSDFHFCFRSWLQLLSECDYWYVDGTFKRDC